MNKRGKITLGVMIGTAAVAAPLSYVAINKGSDAEIPIVDITGVVASADKMYNFDFPEKFIHTYTLTKEVIRIVLNSLHGYADVSNTSLASHFADPSKVKVWDIKKYVESGDFTLQQINDIAEAVTKADYYQEYGFKIQSSKMGSTKESIRNYLTALNMQFIYEDTLHETFGPNRLFGGMTGDYAIYSNGRFMKFGSFIDSISNVSVIKSDLNNKKMYLSYKIPEFIIPKADVGKNNSMTIEPSSNSVIRIQSSYDRYAYLKNINSLYTDEAFVRRHVAQRPWNPTVPIFYEFKKYDKFYRSGAGMDFQRTYGGGRTFYNINQNGAMWERAISTPDLTSEIDDNLNTKYNISNVPLNKTIFFDKLHSTQSSKYGVVPTIGTYNGFNDGTYEMNKSFEFDSKKKALKAKEGNSNFVMMDPNFSSGGQVNYNYINKMIFWNTTGNKILGIPPASMTNEAHRNGSKMYGLCFPSGMNAINQILFEDCDELIAAKQLIKIAKRNKFDGWFMDMEVAKKITAENKYFKNKIFSRIARIKRMADNAGIDLVWYGIGRGTWIKSSSGIIAPPPLKRATVIGYDDVVSMVEHNKYVDDNLSYQFNYDSNYQPLLDDDNMPKYANLNPYINWPGKGSISQDSAGKAMIDYFYNLEKRYAAKGYGGIMWQTWPGNSRTGENYSWILNELWTYVKAKYGEDAIEWFGDINLYGDGSQLWSNQVGMTKAYKEYGSHFHSDWWASGMNADPRDVNTSAFSRFIQERSTIGGTKSFYTSFNTSTSWKTRVHGEVRTENGRELSLIANEGISSKMPTYRWITDVYDDNDNPIMWTKRKDFHKEIREYLSPEDSYQGSDSIKFVGNLPAHSKFVNRLYGSNIDNSNTRNWEITFKGETPNLVSWEDNSSKMSIEPDSVTRLQNGWSKAVYSGASGVSKYFGIEYNNSSDSSVNLTGSYIDSIAWNKQGYVIDDPLKLADGIADSYYDPYDELYSINAKINVPMIDNVHYEIYNTTPSGQRDNLIAYNEKALFREEKIEPKDVLNNNFERKYIIIAKHSNGDILSTSSIIIKIQEGQTTNFIE